MKNQEDYQVLIDESLDVAPTGAAEVKGETVKRGRGELAKGEAIIGDEVISVLRENRIRLAKGKTEQRWPAESGETGQAYYVIPLICAVQPHPLCRFLWSRLSVDLKPTGGAIVRDMFPREVRGENPIELKSSLGLGLRFEIAQALTLDPKVEHTTTRTIYYPKITSSGTGFEAAYWDFLALAGEYLHSDRELFLLFSAPADVPVYANFNLEAQVAYKGWLGLFLRRSGEINQTYRIA
jgi:hypothetical protein